MWSGEVSSVLWATFTELGYWVFFLAVPAKHLMRSRAVLERFRTSGNAPPCQCFSVSFCVPKGQGQTSLIELATGAGSYRRVTLYSDIACKRPQGFTLLTRKWMSRVWGICAWVLWGKWFHMLHFQSQTSMFRWRPLCFWFMPAFVMLHKLTECVFLYCAFYGYYKQW